LTELVGGTKHLFGCQERGLNRVTNGHLWHSNTSSCGHFQQLSTSSYATLIKKFT